MTTEAFRTYQEQTFDSFCKSVIRNESTDARRELAAKAEREVPLSSINVSFEAFREMSAQCVNRGNEHADVYEEIKENTALPKDRAASYEHNDTR